MTKADLVPDASDRSQLGDELRALGVEPRWISSATGEGIDALIGELARAVGAS